MLHICRTLSCFGTNLSYFEPDLSCFHRVYPTLSPICPTLLLSFVLPYFRWKRQPDPWSYAYPWFTNCTILTTITSTTSIHEGNASSATSKTKKKTSRLFLPNPRFRKCIENRNFQNIWVCQKWYFRQRKSWYETTLQ